MSASAFTRASDQPIGSPKELPEAIHVVVVVYGKVYSELLAEITLANLAAMVREIPDDLRRSSRLRILTRNSDIATIESSPALPALRQSLSVEIIDSLQMTGFDKHGDYGPMVNTQRQAVVDAAGVNAALFFVGPDQIYNRGAFSHFIECMRKGYRVVIGPGTRIKRDAIRPYLRSLIANSTDGTFALDAEDQTALFFDYWHPINDQYVIGSTTDIWWKAYIYHHPHPDELFIRFFQGPTLVAWPRENLEGFDGFIDHDLILRCCRNWREAYVVTDGLECLALDMTDDNRKDVQPLADMPRIDLLKEFFDRKGINNLQLFCGLRTCRIHRGERDLLTVRRYEEDFSRSIDPLILIALADRAVSKWMGAVIGSLFRIFAFLNTSTLCFLLRAFGSRKLQRHNMKYPLETYTIDGRTGFSNQQGTVVCDRQKKTEASRLL